MKRSGMIRPWLCFWKFHFFLGMTWVETHPTKYPSWKREVKYIHLVVSSHQRYNLNFSMLFNILNLYSLLPTFFPLPLHFSHFVFKELFIVIWTWQDISYLFLSAPTSSSSFSTCQTLMIQPTLIAHLVMNSSWILFLSSALRSVYIFL